MAVLTPLELGDARRIGSAFGLRVTAVRGILGGSVNSNFELEVEGTGSVFARIFEEQTLASARGEAGLLDHLASRGVPTPRPLRAESGDFVVEHAGKPIALFPWAPGDSICLRGVDVAKAHAVGVALARVHLAGASYAAPTSRFGPPELARRLDALSDRTDLPPDVAAVLPRLVRTLAPFLDAPLAEDGLIHGDLFRDNVLWVDGRIEALLDFESASRGSYPFDLMVTGLAWCGDALDPSLTRALGQGYNAVRPIPPDEIDRLFEAARFAALRFSITRITDFELRPRGSGVYKDFRRFIARLSRVEALGPRDLTTALGLDPSRAAG